MPDLFLTAELPCNPDVIETHTKYTVYVNELSSRQMFVSNTLQPKTVDFRELRQGTARWTKLAASFFPRYLFGTVPRAPRVNQAKIRYLARGMSIFSR